jgi:hypothetical protein
MNSDPYPNLPVIAPGCGVDVACGVAAGVAGGDERGNGVAVGEGAGVVAGGEAVCATIGDGDAMGASVRSAKRVTTATASATIPPAAAALRRLMRSGG